MVVGRSVLAKQPTYNQHGRLISGGQPKKLRALTAEQKTITSVYEQNAKENVRNRQKHNRKSRRAVDSGDEELDMEALADYVSELKNQMGHTSSSTAESRKKGLSVHEMSKVKKKVYSALNQADIVIKKQRERANIPSGMRGSSQITKRVSAASLRPRLHYKHQAARDKRAANKGGWASALRNLTADRIAWFETVTYVAPGKSGTLKKCPANRAIVQDALDGDPYAGFRSQIMNLPKPNRNAVAKKIVSDAPKKKVLRRKLGFGGSGSSRPAMPGHPGYNEGRQTF
jgi:hypothetical protein